MRRRIAFGIFLFLLLGTVQLQGQKLSRPVADTNLVLPPAWAFGILYGGYTNQQETVERIRQIQQHQYPVDAYWIDSWFWSYADKGIGPHKYLDFVGDTVSYPDRKAMWSFMQQNNIKGGFWVWDCILEKGNEQAFKDFKERGFFRNVYVNKNSWHNKGTSTAMFQEKSDHPGTLCGEIDFNSPAAVAYFKQRMKSFFDDGADFIKLDRTSDINTCKAIFELSQEFGKETKGRGFILSHTGGMENESYKRYPTKWTDDTRSDWNIETPLVKFNDWVPFVALKENMAMYTDPQKQTSQIPFLANDLGGFDMGKTNKPEEELYIRWMEFSVFNAITEVFSQPENPTSNLPWMYSARADSLFRFYSHWRMQLFPYLYSAAHQRRIAGTPVIGKTPGYIYQYLFGGNMLVAPVFEKGAVVRSVYFPDGKWVDYWTGKIINGGAEYKTIAPLAEIPLFVKQGSIIPQRKYFPSIEKGNNDTLELHTYPGADGQYTLIEDDGTSNGYLNDEYAATAMEWKEGDTNSQLTINPPVGSYKGMNKNRVWEIVIHTANPFTQATINGKKGFVKVGEGGRTVTCTTGRMKVRKKLVFRFN